MTANIALLLEKITAFCLHSGLRWRMLAEVERTVKSTFRTNGFRAFPQDDGWAFVKPGQVIIVLMEFKPVLGLTQLIGQIQPGVFLGGAGAEMGNILEASCFGFKVFVMHLKFGGGPARTCHISDREIVWNQDIISTGTLAKD